MSDNVLVIDELNTIAVVDSTAALVSVVDSVNDIVVVEVQLQNQVVIADENKTVTVESSAKGEKGDKGDPADLDPDVINPIIDGRITSITNTVAQIDSKINAAVTAQNLLWNTALTDARSEIDSNLSTGLNGLQDALDALDTSVQVDLTAYNTTLTNAINTAKAELEAADLDIDAKFVDLTNTINVELSTINTDLATITFDVGQFNTDLTGVNTLLNSTITDYSQFKTLTNGLIGEINDAVFMLDPQTGQVVLKAYHYTDDKFNLASIRMDAIDGSINLANSNITAESDRITTATSRIGLLEGQIVLKASYAEMNEAISGAISAVLPAYSFGFFNSTEGWTAVTGTIANTGNKVSVTMGDITNQGLSYSADDNPSISVTITRTAGTGWTGDMYITYQGGSTVHYPSVFLDVPSGSSFTRILNLAEVGTYTGTVTGIRFVFGATTADTFDLDDITIGKPSAAITQLEGLQGQINDLGIDIDAVNASLTNYVTVANYNANTITYNNVSSVLDGNAAIISLKATQTLLNNNGTISKANSASTWVDAANANITSAISTFNAQPDGIDSKLGTLTGNYNTLRSEMDAATGTIKDSIVSIYGLKIGLNDVNKAGIYAQLKMKQLQDNALAIGDSVAVAQQQLNAMSTEQSALSQQILQLNASFGSYIGQLNSQIINLEKAYADADIAIATSISQVNANLSGTIDANYQTLVQSIADANQATVTSGEQLEAKFNNSIQAVDESLRTLVANQNFASVESVDLVRAELNNDYASKDYLLSVVAETDAALVNEVEELQARIDYNNVVINSELDSVRKLIANESEATAKVIDGIAVQFGTATSALSSTIETLKATQTESLATVVSMLEAKFENNLASKQELTVAMADERQATLTDISTLSASVGTTYATKTSVTDAIATETNARITAINSLSSNVGTTYATKNELTTAITNERAASVQDVNTLSATVANTYATQTGMTTAIANETTARVNALNSLNTSIGNTYATKTDLTDAVSTETQARVSALSAMNASIAGTYATTASLTSAIATQNSAMISYVDSKQASYDGMYASIARVDLIESTVNLNRASTELAVYATNIKVNNNAKNVVRTLLDLDKQRKNLLEQGDAIAIGQRQIAVEVSNTALAQEKAELIAAIGRLDGQANSNFTQVNKAIADETSNRVSALTELKVSVDNNVIGLTSQLNSLSSSTNGLVTAVNGINTSITDPERGLNALLSSVQSASAKADTGIEATNTISARLNDPATGLSALYTFNQTASIIIDGLSTSVTNLASRTTTNEDNYSTAMLQLSSVSDSVGTLEARAFLGVKSVNSGKATINGIEINGVTNTILFQADTFGLVNTAGEQQLFYNTVKGKWEFKGDLVAGTYQTATSGMRVEITGEGELLIWAGTGDKTRENAVFYVDSSGVVKAKNMSLENPVVTTPAIKNARLDFVGSQYLRVEAAEPFGPNNLISWFGKIIDGVNLNTETREPIYANLLRSNAKTYISADGEVYFGGTFQAGVISNSGSTTLISGTASREIEFTSNGGLITIAVSFTYSQHTVGPTEGNLDSLICPVDHTIDVPTGIVYLENWNGSAWVTLNQWPVSGTYTCNDGSYEPEPGTPNIPYNEFVFASASGSYTDQSGVYGARKLRVRLAGVVGTGYGASQSLSITTSE